MTNTEYQCIGCGAVIQTSDPDAPGYLPASAFEKGKETGDFYCQRCFRLRHYNELQDLDLDENVFLDRLNEVASDDAFVVHVIDILDVEGTVLTGLERFIGHQPYIVVANKVDLLPKSVKTARLRQWLTERLHENGMRPDDVLLISSKKGHTLEALYDRIQREATRRNCYIVGVTNVGKSTLINQLIRHFGGESDIITTSNFPGTTLDLIQIPVTATTAIYDTPGIIRSNQMLHCLTRDSMQAVIPSKPIKPRTFQLNADQTIFLGGLARLTFTQGEKTAFTFYVSNDLYLHRTKAEKADAFYHTHRGTLLTPPSEDELAHFPEWVTYSIQLKADQDLLIFGLGWVTVNHPVRLELSLPKPIAYAIRPTMI